MLRLRALASMVLPTPGTSSMRMWPSHIEGDESQPHLGVLADDDAFDVADRALGRLLDVRALLMKTLGHGQYPSLRPSGSRGAVHEPFRRSHSAMTRPPIGAAVDDPDPAPSTMTATAMDGAAPGWAGTNPMNHERGGDPRYAAVPVLPAVWTPPMP